MKAGEHMDPDSSLAKEMEKIATDGNVSEHNGVKGTIFPAYGGSSTQLVYRLPCSCGCDYRSNPHMKGYFIASCADAEQGFNIVVNDENLHRVIIDTMENLKLEAQRG